MTMVTQDQFKMLLPLACEWAQEQERIILRDGVPLTGTQMEDARAVGVQNPERVRLLSVKQIPVPEHPALKAAAADIQLITPQTEGLTLRYGIYIRSDCWEARRLLVHEFVHTAQYERFGGFQEFLQQYLDECNIIGYPAAPMEQEAITLSARRCV
jgi:hypothetical protein